MVHVRAGGGSRVHGPFLVQLCFALVSSIFILLDLCNSPAFLENF